MKEIVLTGLDGSNPLAFLAALGALHVLSESQPEVTLRWEIDGVWRPILGGIDSGIDDVLACFDADRKECIHEPALALEYEGKRDLKPEPSLFRGYLEQLVEQATRTRRRGVDWAGAFASDVVVDNNGNTKPTALHFTAGQQQFLRMVNELAAGVTRENLREALVGPWSYSSPLPVMGWDATIARDYALRASNPSGDKKLGVPGVDWLAVRGLVLLPVSPVGPRLTTTGCIGGWKTGRFRWGLWTVALRHEVVRSTLRLDVEEMERDERDGRGIGVVFSCGIKRSDQGGYGTFEPASLV